MKKYIIFILPLLAVMLYSCEEYIEPDPDNKQPFEVLLEDPARIEGLILQVYQQISKSYNFSLEVATDDAVTNSITSSYRRMASESWLSTGSPIDIWADSYEQLQYLNYFMELKGSVEKPITHFSEEDNDRFFKGHMNRLTAEAFALRAWVQFHLLQSHGGLGTNDEMLGFPILTRTLTTDDDLNLPRDSFDKCVEQIYKDCDSALALFNGELEYSDNYASGIEKDDIDKRTSGEDYINRINGGAAMALKAKTALLAASPAFTVNKSVSEIEQLWTDAARYSGELMLALGNGTFTLPASGHIFYTFEKNDNELLDESIWKHKQAENQSSYENLNFPPSLEGNGQINPTNNFVESFPDAAGVPISTAALDTLPYVNRDPRLSLYVMYNGNKYVDGGDTIYTYQGNPDDGINDNQFATRTGYYLKKFINGNVVISGNNIAGANRNYVFIRYTEIALIFAEAANEAYGPDVAVPGIGLTAEEVINAIRSRVGIGNSYTSTLTTKDQFRNLIRNERRIELCFEGKRFWDIRRWNDLTTMKAGVNGVFITKSGSGNNVKYDISNVQEVEKRTYEDHMIYAPIPYYETLKYNLTQNKGW